MTSPLHKLMPDVLEHRGIWQGTYRHIYIEVNIIDFHKSQVEWDDGRKFNVAFDGIIKNDRIYCYVLLCVNGQPYLDY
jgi:hypothetical protein